MFVFFFLFFLHGALKLEGFQRIRDFNAREVIMLVVQVKCKNGSGCMFLRVFLQKNCDQLPTTIIYGQAISKSSPKKCIHFQSLLSSTSLLLTSSTECIKRNFRFLWSMTRHTFWTSWIERSTKLASHRGCGCDVVDACWRWWWFRLQWEFLVYYWSSWGRRRSWDFLICQLAMCFW